MVEKSEIRWVGKNIAGTLSRDLWCIGSWYESVVLHGLQMSFIFCSVPFRLLLTAQLSVDTMFISKNMMLLVMPLVSGSNSYFS